MEAQCLCLFASSGSTSPRAIEGWNSNLNIPNQTTFSIIIQKKKSIRVGYVVVSLNVLLGQSFLLFRVCSHFSFRICAQSCHATAFFIVKRKKKSKEKTKSNLQN